MDFLGFLGFLELFAHPLATIGAVLGLVLGGLAAFGLHWLLPYHPSAGAQALLLLLGFVVGLVVGHLGDERFIRKR